MLRRGGRQEARILCFFAFFGMMQHSTAETNARNIIRRVQTFVHRCRETNVSCCFLDLDRCLIMWYVIRRRKADSRREVCGQLGRPSKRQQHHISCFVALTSTRSQQAAANTFSACCCSFTKIVDQLFHTASLVWVNMVLLRNSVAPMVDNNNELALSFLVTTCHR